VITLIVATRNKHKAQEIQAILGAEFRLLDLHSFPNAPAIAEDAPTFEGNALKKAVELASWLTQTSKSSAVDWSAALTLADDSGLEVDALNGAPGVHSARYAALADGSASATAGNSPDLANNAKLLGLLKDVPLSLRTGRFRCVLALAPVYANPKISQPLFFEGKCEGTIGFAPKGKSGFGYDPLFTPLGHAQTFAELGEKVKNTMSHRARALGKLKGFLCSW